MQRRAKLLGGCNQRSDLDATVQKRGMRDYFIRQAPVERRRRIDQRARRANPERWRGDTRNWNPIDVVVLNPQAEAASDLADRIRRQLS
jgi:hypothetical protein